MRYACRALLYAVLLGLAIAGPAYADATVALGRDPKKEKPAKAEGAKRGRPVGSKNKPKEVAPAATETAPAVEGNTVVVIDTPVAEAAPAVEPALM